MPSYFVTVSYDLHGATSADYDIAYNDLSALGLEHVLMDQNGQAAVLPNTTVGGVREAASAAGLRDFVSGTIASVFRQRAFVSTIFVAVGTDWAWTERKT